MASTNTIVENMNKTKTLHILTAKDELALSFISLYWGSVVHFSSISLIARSGVQEWGVGNILRRDSSLACVIDLLTLHSSSALDTKPACEHMRVLAVHSPY